MLRSVHALLPGMLGVVLGMLLSGCVSMGHIDKRVGTINQSVGSVQNQAILLNIVRASKNEPLYFVSVSGVGGAGGTGLSTALPDVAFGTGLSMANQSFIFSNSLSNSTSTNFDVGVLQSRDFYRGLLQQLNLVEANLLIHQGFSREMVFSLLVDHIRVRAGGGVRLIRNDPGLHDFNEFSKYMALAVDYGLTIGTYEAGGAAVGRLCFDEALALPHLAASARTLRPNCETLQSTRGSAELAFSVDGRPQTIGIVLRSPYQIFQYLGGQLANRTAKRVLVDTGKGGRAEPMLVVQENGATSCFAYITYEGSSYCVPSQGAGNTKRVFDLINQILALNTSVSDLPITTTVRIAQ